MNILLYHVSFLSNHIFLFIDSGYLTPNPIISPYTYETQSPTRKPHINEPSINDPYTRKPSVPSRKPDLPTRKPYIPPNTNIIHPYTDNPPIPTRKPLKPTRKPHIPPINIISSYTEKPPVAISNPQTIKPPFIDAQDFEPSKSNENPVMISNCECKCDDGQCLSSKDMICNGIKDCVDESDELNCIQGILKNTGGWKSR